MILLKFIKNWEHLHKNFLQILKITNFTLSPEILWISQTHNNKGPHRGSSSISACFQHQLSSSTGPSCRSSSFCIAISVNQFSLILQFFPPHLFFSIVICFAICFVFSFVFSFFFSFAFSFVFSFVFFFYCHTAIEALKPCVKSSPPPKKI